MAEGKKSGELDIILIEAETGKNTLNHGNSDGHMLRLRYGLADIVDQQGKIKHNSAVMGSSLRGKTDLCGPPVSHQHVPEIVHG